MKNEKEINEIRQQFDSLVKLYEEQKKASEDAIKNRKPGYGVPKHLGAVNKDFLIGKRNDELLEHFGIDLEKVSNDVLTEYGECPFKFDFVYYDSDKNGFVEAYLRFWFKNDNNYILRGWKL